MNYPLVGIPTEDGWVRHELMLRVFEETMNFGAVTVVNGVKPVDDAREEMVRRFLQTDATHLVMIDADTIPPVGFLKMLFGHDFPVVSGVTYMLRNSQHTTNVFETMQAIPLQDTKKYGDKPFMACGVGASCLMIRRDVLEQLIDKHGFAFRSERTDAGLISEDIAFCNAVGNKILIDPRVRCRHVKEVLL